MFDIHTLTDRQFEELPLVIKGESKEVRYAGEGQVAIRFLPTIYSFTHNRCAEVPGSEVPRLRASLKFVEVLRAAGIRHAYLDGNDRFMLAQLVLPHQVEFAKYGLPPFVPNDLTAEQIAALPKAPPIEVVVKNALTGTTKHGCIGLAGSRVRSSHPFYAGQLLEPDVALPEMLVRFDWRNPLKNEVAFQRIVWQAMDESHLMKISQVIRRHFPEFGFDGVSGNFFDDVIKTMARDVFGLDRVADTVLPEQLANLFIDVHRARRTAFIAAKTIEEFLGSKDIVFYDICLFIDESGEMLYGEVSPDCGRYRHLDLGELDKDVWRSGGSSADVIAKWHLLCKLMGIASYDKDGGES
ncbi:MAG: hypothetical protein V1738_00955 [Patescibacteria group bacterium]